MTTVSNLRPALAASKTGMFGEVGCAPLAAICAWTNSMWSSISTLATFSLAISSASGSTSTEVTELDSLESAGAQPLASPEPRDSLGSHHDRGDAEDRASATEVENVTLVDVVERSRGRVDHPRGEMCRSHILFEFALLPTNGQVHSLSLRIVHAANLWLCESLQRLQFCRKSREIGGVRSGSASELLGTLTGFQLFQLHCDRSSAGPCGDRVGGLQDAVDEFLSRRRCRLLMPMEIVAAEQHENVQYSRSTLQALFASPDWWRTPLRRIHDKKTLRRVRRSKDDKRDGPGL